MEEMKQRQIWDHQEKGNQRDGGVIKVQSRIFLFVYFTASDSTNISGVLRSIREHFFLPTGDHELL